MSVERDDVLQTVTFADLDIEDPFFLSLRKDYNPGFDEWFARKSASRKPVRVVYDENGFLIAMLYIKVENDVDAGVTPTLLGKRMKIGTFKVDFDHHTSIGKRLLASALRDFATSDCEYIYVTMFERQNTESLRKLLSQYGFYPMGSKESNVGHEVVWSKKRPLKGAIDSNVCKAFPFVASGDGNAYLLAILPKYHARMFGEVNLQSEMAVAVADSVPINTIEKIYLSAAKNASLLRAGDHIVIYRMTDIQNQAYYRSVITSVCTVTNVCSISSFSDKKSFFRYVKGRSVFSDEELEYFWRVKKYPWIISMVFNFPLHQYPNRKMLIDRGLISEKTHIVCEPITSLVFRNMVKLGGVDEGYVVD